MMLLEKKITHLSLILGLEKWQVK